MQPDSSGETQARPRSAAFDSFQRLSVAAQDLKRDIDQQDADRRDLIQRVKVLEQELTAYRAREELLFRATRDPVEDEELEDIRQVVDHLREDPDHILRLAAAGQCAPQLLRIVDAYRWVRAALRNAGDATTARQPGSHPEQ